MNELLKNEKNKMWPKIPNPETNTKLSTVFGFQLMMDNSDGSPKHIKDEPARFFSQLMLNSALHPYSQSRKIFATIDQARNYARKASEHEGGGGGPSTFQGTFTGEST